MPRIPLPDRVDPRSIQGDRLTQMSGDGFSAPGRALQQLGSELSQLASKFKSDTGRIDEYNSNLVLEKWANDQSVAYKTELASSAPDGSDFIPTREANLTKSFQGVRKNFKNPDHQAKADLTFERVRGDQVLRGMDDVSKRRMDYVTTTTDLAIDRAVNTGQLQSEDQYNDYFETVVKPRIDTYITDPVAREVQYAKFGAKLGKAYLEKHPERAAPLRASLARNIDDTGQINFLASRGVGGEAAPERVAKLNPTFRVRLANAVRDAERATGTKVSIRSAYRSPEEQAVHYANYMAGKGGLAAPPGRSRHQHGLAADINDGPALKWLHQHAQEYGLSFLKGNAFKNDTGHIQIADNDSGMKYPDVPMEKPKGGVWQYVGQEEWEGAATKAARVEEQNKKDAEAAKKLADDELVRDGYDLIADDGLDAHWIEDNRESLTPAQYRTFQNALARQSKSTETDNKDYIDLFERAVKDPNQDDVQDDAFLLFSEGKLAKTDFNRIFALSRSTQRAEERPWLRDIRSTLSSRLAPLSRDDKDQYAQRQDGLFALDDWIEKNPNASRDEVKKKANEIAKLYTDGIDLRAKLDKPLYSTVGRTHIDQSALQIAAQKTLAAYKAGKLNRDELVRETTLLKKWQDTLNEEARSGKQP